MPAFVELTFGNAALALSIMASFAIAAGYLYYLFRSQKPKVRADAIQELSEAFAALKAKCDLLETKMKEVVAEHERCERKLNNVAAFNLRLQAREMRYQKTINHLERRAGLETTNFDDITEAQEDSAFR